MSPPDATHPRHRRARLWREYIVSVCIGLQMTDPG